MNDDQKKYLMKRKRYGWGWIPVTWQGWLLLLLQVGIMITAATFLPHKPAQPTTSEWIRFFIIFGFAFLNILLIGDQTAPRMHWRWGKKPSDNPDEDF